MNELLGSRYREKALIGRSRLLGLSRHSWSSQRVLEVGVVIDAIRRIDKNHLD